MRAPSRGDFDYLFLGKYPKRQPGSLSATHWSAHVRSSSIDYSLFHEAMAIYERWIARSPPGRQKLLSAPPQICGHPAIGFEPYGSVPQQRIGPWANAGDEQVSHLHEIGVMPDGLKRSGWRWLML